MLYNIRPMIKADTVNIIQIIIQHHNPIISKCYSYYMTKISQKTLLLLSLITLLQAVIFQKQVNSADPKALCLNGAQSFIYTSNLTTSAEGIIVYFMPTPTPVFCGGDSLSSSLDKCVTVSDQISSYWSTQLNITSGILADASYQNWAKVIIPACDGALFQGFASNAIKYKGKDLYFRGNRVVKSNLDHIFNKRFNATKINQFVFAGSGFGAIGALVWSRYFYDQIVLSSGKNKHFSLILDTIPFSYNSIKTKNNEYETSLQNMLKLANVDELTPFILCTLRNQGEQWRCFKLEETYYYLSFPVMLVDSQYDTISLEKIIEVDCVNKNTGSLSQCSQTQRNYIEDYRSNKMVKLYSFVNFHGNSVWSISCSAPSFLNSDKYSSFLWNVGGNLAQNIKQFISQSRIANFNHISWPSNEKCSS